MFSYRQIPTWTSLPLTLTVKTFLKMKFSAKKILQVFSGESNITYSTIFLFNFFLESALSNFAQASGSKPANKVFRPPSIPKGYKPFVGVKESHEERSKQEEPQKHHHLTSDERGRLLGEQPLAKSVKSVFDYMSKSDKDRLASADDTRVTSPVASKTRTLTESFFSQNTPISSSGFQPFSNNPAKQARYQNFLQLRKSGKEINLPKELRFVS